MTDEDEQRAWGLLHEWAAAEVAEDLARRDGLAPRYIIELRGRALDLQEQLLDVLHPDRPKLRHR